MVDATHGVVPRGPGSLTPGWRLLTLAAWCGVIAAFAAVWSASVQLGLATWWLGPRGDRQPLWIQLAPFVAPLALVIAAINDARQLPRWGLAAALVLGLIGWFDMGQTSNIAWVELTIAGAAGAISAASRTGMYRLDEPTGDHNGADR